MREALRGGPDPESVKVLKRTYASRRRDGSYELEMSEWSVDSTDYFNFTLTKRNITAR